MKKRVVVYTSARSQYLYGVIMSSGVVDRELSHDFSEFGQTPSGNTVLFSQVSHSPSNSPFTVKVDWINFTFSFTDSRVLLERADAIARLFVDDIQWHHDKVLFRGRSFASRGESAHGILIGFTPPSDDGSMGDAFVSIPATAIDRVEQREVFHFIRAVYHIWNAKFSRLDIALDDYGKKMNPSQIEMCLTSGFFTGFNKLPNGWKKKSGTSELEGWTYYLGCPKSNKQLCFYDKSFETNGEIDSQRWEMRFKRELAPEVARDIAERSRTYLTHPDLADKYMACSLTNLIFSNFSFVDRRAVDRDGNEYRQRAARSPVFPWWQLFVDSVSFDKVVLTVERPEPTMERTERWHDKSVSTSLAMKRIELGKDEFIRYINDLADRGECKLNHRHIAMLNAREMEVTTQMEMQKGGKNNGTINAESGKEVCDFSEGNCNLYGAEIQPSSTGIYEQLEFLFSEETGGI